VWILSGYNTYVHGKCYNEAPCIAILYSKSVFFFFSKPENWKVKQVLFGTSGMEDVRKECRKMNIVEILGAYVWKWKNETCWNCSKNGERRMKENDGGEGTQLWYIVRTLVNVTIYPPSNNNKKYFFKKWAGIRNQRKAVRVESTWVVTHGYTKAIVGISLCSYP
jgi:hypothetical protein